VSAPEFLVIGHVAKDVVEGGWRPGGTVTYAAAQASRLGLRTGVVTRASEDVDLAGYLPGVCVHRVLSEMTTTFENRYSEGRRAQYVWAQASPIGAEQVPQECRGARMVLLGPLLGEVPIGLARLFRGATVGFCAQGWLREVQADGLVVRRPWAKSACVRGASVVVASEEDIEDDEEALKQWQRESPIVVVTGGKGGARIYVEGRERRIAAFPHEEVDPTGAGDVFATSFMIALDEKRDVAAAARFAAAAAGLSIEAEGTAKVGTREEIERVLAAHPEVVLE
jgi:sugar/nucleoside kinase (ribokinase family)